MTDFCEDEWLELETEQLVQCKLHHLPTDSWQMAWIPYRFAQEGKTLRIKENGQWEDGWKVVEKYDEVTISFSSDETNIYSGAISVAGRKYKRRCL